MLRHLVGVLTVAVLSALSVNASRTSVVENVGRLPEGWMFHRAANYSDTVRLSIVLKEPKVQELKARLLEISRPDHPAYGTYLSQKQVEGYRQPDQSSANLVTGWLKSSGIRDVHVSGSVVSFSASVSTVKSLLSAELAYYRYQKERPVLRARSYSVPLWLHNEIAFVHPLTNFMRPRRGLLQKKNGSSQPHARDGPGGWNDAVSGTDMPCLTGTYPECIKTLYNVTYNATAPSPVRFGVAGFLEQFASPEDVTGFLTSYAPELANMTPPYNYSTELVNFPIGGNGSSADTNNIQTPGLEASLDVEYALAIGYPAAVTYYVTAGRGIKLGPTGLAVPDDNSDNEPYLEFLSAMLSRPDEEIPHVLSISYADDEQSVPKPYAERVCDMFAALSARGCTILTASGDGGAAGTGQSQCVANDGADIGSITKMFVPTFPASCPYVTSVGATDNRGPPVRGASFSAGGFSNYFGRPAWQDEAVGAYIGTMAQGNDERLGLFNSSGRAIPDISAIGSGFQIQMAGSVSEVLGTSASTPVVAAMLALVNDARLRSGKNATGWLNPALYSPKVKETLFDVIKGRSQGCYFPDNATAPGWEAIAGYDCVTGLGTPSDFGKLLAVLS